MIEEVKFFCRENPVLTIVLLVIFFGGFFYLLKIGNDTTFQPWDGMENVFIAASCLSIPLGLLLALKLPADNAAYRRILGGAALVAVCYIIAYTIIDRTLPSLYTGRFGTETEMDVVIASHTTISRGRLTRGCRTALQIVAAENYDKKICATPELYDAYKDADHITVPALESALGRMPRLDNETLQASLPFRHRG